MTDKRSDALSTTVQAGTPLSTLLTVLFVALKLTGHLPWDWVWVLSPLWFPLALFMGALSVLFTVFWVKDLFKWK